MHTKNQILCSTGCFIGRKNNRNYHLIEEAVQTLHCDGYELMMYSSWYEKETLNALAAVIKNSAGNVVSFHSDKDVGDLLSRNGAGDAKTALRMFRINCELAEKVGAKLVVLHLWGGQDSDREISNNLRAYPELRKMADASGLILAVENVVCNCKNPMVHLKELLELDPTVKFTIDTRMTAFHAQFQELFTAVEDCLLPSSIAHIHFSDYCGGYMDWNNKQAMELGTGNIDFPSFIHFLNKISYSASCVLESTCIEPGLNIERLNRNLDYLAGQLNFNPSAF